MSSTAKPFELGNRRETRPGSETVASPGWSGTLADLISDMAERRGVDPAHLLRNALAFYDWAGRFEQAHDGFFVYEDGQVLKVDIPK